tara:strand:+ start:93226 stop:93891 length:666 start_codon:yes stop_codon:yes gene_type:complete
MTNRPSLSQRHDLGVLIVALAMLAGGALVHRYRAAPSVVPYAKEGLVFERPGGWLPAQIPAVSVSPLVQHQAGFGVATTIPTRAPNTVHTIYVSPLDARRRIEVRIEDRPAYSNLRGALAVARLGQYGEFYWARHSGNATIANRDWLRTEFRYAFKANKGSSPQIAEAVEYAIVNAGRLFVVTLHDEPDSPSKLEPLVAKTLRISTRENSSQEQPTEEAKP